MPIDALAVGGQDQNLPAVTPMDGVISSSTACRGAGRYFCHGQLVDREQGSHPGESSTANSPGRVFDGEQKITLGVVSFLNALPLHASLGGREDLRLCRAVPSALLEMLLAGQCDVALLPVVDYWRHRERLEPAGDGCIASDGETLTVKVYSKAPAERISCLHVDGDSHTSIVLAQVIWRELYGRNIEIAPLSNTVGGWDRVESMLLIGDKVVRDAPRGFGFEVDLGAAWKHLTGLPFVFAAWYGPKGHVHAEMVRDLERARDAGVADAGRIASEYAGAHGWPVDIATTYLCDIMKYRMTDAMREGTARFFGFIEQYGLIP